jgi:phosphoribosylformylglycinamidine cyclo-ligase
VDLDHDESFIDDVKEIAKTTFRPEVLSSIGGFAGMFKAPERYRDPIFVAATDGVGTKLKLAAQIGRYDTIGIDCVAMVVNDLVVQGAEPLIFLDYIAMGDLHKELAGDALRGVAEGCRRAGAALLGGETAELPGLYARGDFDLAGFAVGAAERGALLPREAAAGDALIGVWSSGVHSNGYSLVRRIVADAGLDWGADAPFAEGSLADAFLAPTRIYVPAALALARRGGAVALAHVTGGGGPGNLPRVLPKGLGAEIETAALPETPLFEWLAETGGVAQDEMRRAFNCGVGLIAVVPQARAADALDILAEAGEQGAVIGRVVEGAGVVYR